MAVAEKVIKVVRYYVNLFGGNVCSPFQKYTTDSGKTRFLIKSMDSGPRLPYLATPLGPLLDPLKHAVPLKYCHAIREKTFHCIDAYGYFKSRKLCKDLLADFEECVHSNKQNRRVQLMRQERLRQIKKGEAEYVPLPRIDLI